jgi:tetratricopeptide (TPR) repeat protein
MPLTTDQKKFIRENHDQLSVTELSNRLHLNKKQIERYLSVMDNKISPGRKKLYWVMMFFLPIFLFLLLETFLQIIGYGGNIELFVNAGGDFDQYLKCNSLVGRRFFSRQSTLPNPPYEIFLKNKPENCYRIFVMGGSTAAGYPYGENLMFSRILHQYLSEVFPEKHIEVVNVAMAAINSYALLDFINEILANAPDAILIYAGHNEFYGALGVASIESSGKYPWMVKLYLKLRRFKSFVLLQTVVGYFRGMIARIFSGAEIGDSSATLMERLVADQKIAYQSRLYKLGKKQFEENLTEILERTHIKNVPVLLSELISNVKDQSPFVSVSFDSFPEAIAVYDDARKLERQGFLEQARMKYYYAKDLDALRFRATEEFNQIIHQIAKKYQVKVVPLRSYFEKASPNGFIGNNLMLEHLHPNIDGYFLMAEAFYETMRRNGFITDKWPERNFQIFRKKWGYTELDSLYGNLRIRILKGGWPFEPKEAPNKALLNYIPISKADSLAVKVWMEDDFNLERAHFEMAKYYETQRYYLQAFHEYRALICLTPYNASPYLNAADMLIKIGRLEEALPILLKSLPLENTHFANKWVGQILLQQSRVKESIGYLEEALKLNARDPQLLYNLSGAYALDGQYKKATGTLDKLMAIQPNFPDADILKNQLDQLLKR